MEKNSGSSELQKFGEKVAELFDGLIAAAWNTSSIDVLYAVVRVSGMSDPGWDPFSEAITALSDYKELIETAEKEGHDRRLIRLKLLYYCHLVEVSAPLDLLYNILRIRAKSPYHIRPFYGLYRQNKKSLKVVPPSVNQKRKELEKMAVTPHEQEFMQIYKSIYKDEIRNSFFHSDYCLSDDEYRWTESGPARAMKIDELDLLLERAFVFFKSIFQVWDQPGDIGSFRIMRPLSYCDIQRGF